MPDPLGHGVLADLQANRFEERFDQRYGQAGACIKVVEGYLIARASRSQGRGVGTEVTTKSARQCFTGSIAVTSGYCLYSVAMLHIPMS